MKPIAFAVLFLVAFAGCKQASEEVKGPTYQEVVLLLDAETRELERMMGVYPKLFSDLEEMYSDVASACKSAQSRFLASARETAAMIDADGSRMSVSQIQKLKSSIDKDFELKKQVDQQLSQCYADQSLKKAELTKESEEYAPKIQKQQDVVNDLRKQKESLRDQK